MFPYHTKHIVIFCMIFLLKINFWTVDSQPVAICPSNETFWIELGSQWIVIFWEEPTILGSSEDVTLISQSHSNDTIFPPGVTEVMFTFTDAPSGNNFSCSFFVEIIPIDTTPPVITGCSMDLSLCRPLEQPYVEVNFTEPTATDNSGSVYLQSASHKPGDVFTCGTKLVTYAFSDPTGNVATCTFIVIVHDCQGVPPTVYCISDISRLVPVGQQGTTVFWEEPVAIDISGTVYLQHRSHAPGAFFFIGVTQVTYIFADGAGLTTSCSFNVEIKVDDIPPTVNCTDDISITAPSGVNAVPVVWEEPTAIDNSGEEIVQIRRSHDPGSTFPIGETTVMYVFLDSTGNAAECMFNVLVLQAVDDVPPTVHCLDDITITVPSGTTSQSVVWKEPSATDNSGEEPIRISSHDPGFPFPIGETTVTYTFIDSAGNIAQCIFKVILLEEVDDVPPTVNCTDDIIETVPKGTTSQAVAWEEPTAYDNSGEEPLHIRSHDPGFTFPIGETTVYYTFVDATGNTAECSFKIILLEEVDEVPPIVNCTGDITETVPRGTSFHTVSWEEPTAYDNSGDEPLQIRSHDPGSRFPIGRSTVTYSFVDSSGNTANCTFEVILLETVGPVVTMCPFSKTVVTCNSESVVSWIPPKVLDDNSKVTTSSSHSPGDLFETGESEVTYTFTNQSGNVIAQCSFTIVVEKQTENCRTESFIIYIVIAVGVFLAVFLTVTLMIFFLKLCHHVKYSVSSGKGKNDVQMLRVTRRGAV